jgi:hypothetical protein
MITNDRFERDLTSWLHDDATFRVPDHLAEVLEVTKVTRQRPAWSSLERWLPVDTTFRPRFFNAPQPGRLALLAGLIVLLLALAVVAIGSRQPRLPEPFGLARNGELLSWAKGDIVAARSDGTDSHVIVGGPADDLAPLISRNGTRFAFFRSVSQHEFLLMLAAIDGTGVRQVLAKPLIDSDWFEWSADDRRLAIVNSVQDERVLTIVDVDQNTSTDLDVGGLQVDNAVYWLPPDGSRLIFTAHAAGGDTPRGIYTIRSDGSDLQPIAPEKADAASYLGLDVSPDGEVASFWNYEPDASEDGMDSHIHFLDLQTRTDRPMTFDQAASGETDLRFSPDGQNVVLQRESETAQLLITSRDGSGPGLLVGPKFALDQEPGYGFAPDGKTVFLGFSYTKPYFFDVGTGTTTRGPAPIENLAGYQRLAP